MRSLTKSTSSSSEDDCELRRGPWTLEEDTLLIHYIARHGEGRWNLLAQRAGLRRTGKSCRLRWLNYLKPDVKRGNLSPQEQLLILDLHSRWGNRWSKIAQVLPGRTDNEIKNYWRTRVQKQARHLKIDANSTQFQHIIRSLWMPRLLHKIDGSTSTSSMSYYNNASSQPANYGSQHLTFLPQLPKLPQQQQETPSHSNPFDMTMTKHAIELQDQNADSEQCTGPCLSSTESLNIPEIPRVSQYPTSPFHVIDNNSDRTTFVKDCFVESTCYGMETINLANMSVSGGVGNSAGNSHTAESGWIGCDFGDTLWNIDELWQFRNLQLSGESGSCF
ncbi:hypothetical protein K2173_028304 [Erythroxylum novogranatense]|uniref:Uncharacterized protein n=1 Tax=Erythroxylum novogranatense TaxID=1862640 RepID=A0AAV8U1G2_9ROSI|nr:hypothetical protein K2173_028304 [Erythroxylum novogranatense]